ncbi:MAG TPA: hypothetical protein VJN94_00660 [Candidatus Binataceae bacterium]|nr:hypothetical protein [Candidatus Binataceae bacterium]
MHTIAVLVGFASGFILVGHHEPPLELLATSLAVDASLAPLTAVIAARRARSPLLWAILGFVFGAWALGCVLLLRSRRRPEYSPTSDAA